ncbi:MAG TPA: group 1 truncated hemoglobin [Acidimicrobiales bacterium]|nr:group 1 truncated hemoglobin [Acidimicrobiales bacterium]
MSIYDQIGGAPSVTAAVDRFYDKVLADPSLSGYFAGTDLARLKGHQRAFLSAALGGPDMYAGRDMAAAHAGLDITEGAFDAVVRHLVATLTELQVPSDVIEAVGGKLAPLAPQIVSARARPAAS